MDAGLPAGGVVEGAVEGLFDPGTGALRGTLDSLNGLLSPLLEVRGMLDLLDLAIARGSVGQNAFRAGA